ncbi:hypothetical protein ABZW30_08170 [Kitasatospora sp. NPDC004669]|uniref:hypothetical protein n=1 Tax=Kitasatospora sp. NPDC004669 TaxID=3154555 RepID=UPI0033AD71F6
MPKTPPAAPSVDLGDLANVLRMLGDRADATTRSPGTSMPAANELLQQTGDFLTVMRVCADNATRSAGAPGVAGAYADAQRHAATAHRHLAVALDLTLQPPRTLSTGEPAGDTATADTQRAYQALCALAYARNAAWEGAELLDTAAQKLATPAAGAAARQAETVAVPSRPPQPAASAGRGGR